MGRRRRSDQTDPRAKVVHQLSDRTLELLKMDTDGKKMTEHQRKELRRRMARELARNTPEKELAKFGENGENGIAVTNACWEVPVVGTAELGLDPAMDE